MKSKCSDGETVCLEGAVLDYDLVVTGWFGVVGRDVFGVVHSGGDAEVDVTVTLVC